MRILQAIKLPVRTPMPDADAREGVYGAERSTALLCRGLGARGHEVTLVCRPGVQLVPHARALGVNVEPLQTRNGRTLAVVWALVRLGRARRAEILAAHNGRSCRMMSLAARILGVPSVGTMRIMCNAKHFRKTTHIIAVSEGVRQHILAQGVAPSQVTTVHNGADIARFSPPADLGAAKRAIGFVPDDLIVGVIARLSAEKGHDWFLQSVAPLAREFPRARFLLIGEGPLQAELEARAAQLGLAQQTGFAGYQSEIVPWLAAMDALVLPSTAREGFARTLIEAGAMGKPCIASPVGGNDEAIVDGQTGLVVPTNDVSALENAVRRLLANADERAVMGAAARARVETHFSVEAMVEKTEAVYRRVLGVS